MPESKMVKIEDTWGGGKYVSSTVLAKAQAGHPVAISALSGSGYSVKDGKIVKVATGEPVKDVSKEIQEYKEEKEKEKEVKVAEVKAQSPREVSVYDIQSLSKPSDVAKTPSPAEQFQKAAEGKAWNPFSQGWISVPKTEPEKKTESIKIYTTTAPDIKAYEVPEALKTVGTTTAVVTGLPPDVIEGVKEEKKAMTAATTKTMISPQQQKKEPQKFVVDITSLPSKPEPERVTARYSEPEGIYKIESYFGRDIPPDVFSVVEEMKKELGDKASQYGFYFKPDENRILARKEGSLTFSSLEDIYAFESKYGLKDLEIVDLGGGKYDVWAPNMPKDVSLAPVNYVKIPVSDDKEAGHVLKDYVKKDGLEKDFLFVNVDGKKYVMYVGEDEKIRKNLEAKSEEYYNRLLEREIVRQMAERSGGYEGLLARGFVYGGALLNPLSTGIEFIGSKEKDLGKRFKGAVYQVGLDFSEQALQADISTPGKKALSAAKMTLGTEVGMGLATYSGAALLKSALIPVSSAGKILKASAVEKFSPWFYRFSPIYDKSVVVVDVTGKGLKIPWGKIMTGGLIGLYAYQRAPLVAYTVETGEWKPLAKQLGKDVIFYSAARAGFQSEPIPQFVELAKRLEAGSMATSAGTYGVVKPVGKSYMVGQELRFVEGTGKGTRIYNLEFGDLIGRRGKLYSEGGMTISKFGVSDYPLSRMQYNLYQYFKPDIFKTPKQYIGYDTPKFVEVSKVGGKTSIMETEWTRYKPVKVDRSYIEALNKRYRFLGEDLTKRAFKGVQVQETRFYPSVSEHWKVVKTPSVRYSELYSRIYEYPSAARIREIMEEAARLRKGAVWTRAIVVPETPAAMKAINQKLRIENVVSKVTTEKGTVYGFEGTLGKQKVRGLYLEDQGVKKVIGISTENLDVAYDPLYPVLKEKYRQIASFFKAYPKSERTLIYYSSDFPDRFSQVRGIEFYYSEGGKTKPLDVGNKEFKDLIKISKSMGYDLEKDISKKISLDLTKAEYGEVSRIEDVMRDISRGGGGGVARAGADYRYLGREFLKGSLGKEQLSDMARFETADVGKEVLRMEYKGVGREVVDMAKRVGIGEVKVARGTGAVEIPRTVKVSLKPSVITGMEGGLVIPPVTFPVLNPSVSLLPMSFMTAEVQKDMESYSLMPATKALSREVSPASVRVPEPVPVIPEPVPVVPDREIITRTELTTRIVPSEEIVPSAKVTERVVPRIYRFEPPFLPSAFPPLIPSGHKGSRDSGAVPREVEIREPLVDLKKVAATAYPDFYSALVSQAVYGKATAPSFTPEQVEKLREKGYIRVPTKEYRGIEDPNKVLKKIIGGR